MNFDAREIFEELKLVVSGKSLDALLPPLMFLILNRISGLDIAVIVSLGIPIIVGFLRFLFRKPWQYAFGGFIAACLASGLVYLTRSTASYFIPAIATSTILLLLALISLFINKPLAAWISHLTRGWPQDWFWRQDIKPAYREVTIFWSGFLFLRLVFQIILFLLGEGSQLTWVNIVLGWPLTIIVLIISYIYGIWRLHNLGGPGVQEYQKNKSPPWEGQKRGF